MGTSKSESRKYDVWRARFQANVPQSDGLSNSHGVRSSARAEDLAQYCVLGESGTAWNGALSNSVPTFSPSQPQGIGSRSHRGHPLEAGLAWEHGTPL